MVTGVKERRVNARLGEEHASKLEELQRRTGESVTDVVRRGIDLLYREEMGGGETQPLRLLEQAGLVGCWEAAEDLSTRVKEEVTAYLDAKHPEG